MKVNIQSNVPKYNYHFRVNEKGIVGVFGISGSGKTSLLRAISGFQEEVSGSIKFRNKVLLDSNNNKLTKVQPCSYMSQSPILFPHWTVKQNIDFAESHSKVNKNQTDELILNLGCHDLLNQYPSQLSGGERQRIAFIRTLITSRISELILLDEPFSALDEDIRKTALEILQHYKKGNLIFLVTHDINELYHFSNELLLIQDGSISFQSQTSKAMESGINHLPIASKILINKKEKIIYADDVSLSLMALVDSSIVHQIPVTILAIKESNETAVIRLKTHDKQILLAKITKQSLAIMQLTINQNIMANFKATSFK